MRTVTGLVGFARALRHSGMACGPTRVQAFLDAVEHVGLDDRDAVYWAGRLTLCSDPDDVPRYDAAFDCWFGGAALLTEPPGHALPRPTRIAALAGTDAAGGGEDADEPLAAAASDAEVLRRRDLSELGDAEREHLRRMLAVLRPEPPSRPALRHRRSRRGALSSRDTLRAMLRSGGEPVRLARRRRSRRPRRVVLLVDVSGSMSPYADALLRFAHVVVRRSPGSTEVFTLGTRMTRVSRQLRQRDPEVALGAASRAVPDFSGGTRLGETLRVFLDRWGQRGVARGSVVVLFSDGWERGDAAELGDQMRRLRRLARAVIWANPHAGHDGYQPVQSGIVAAMPHVDRMVAGHSLRSLEDVWSWVRRLAQPGADPVGSRS
ncbi:VWA domain-containing protein [Saccharopolyspora subtropica]|uniref:VWA domain-containing protein n=1 Tax=Saccharopolyspora thermophila TaxID=89367 RepID=A0A917JHA7_9PSEU|nr:VWA domain-containing protein [Saccharopolyspora subtropica]GGI68196.1 VWA domain-containing protein [Saccharopolyspora subtropica]